MSTKCHGTQTDARDNRVTHLRSDQHGYAMCCYPEIATGKDRPKKDSNKTYIDA